MDGAADLTRGGGPYACPRSGWLLACPREPDVGRREGSLVKSAAVLVTAWVSAALTPALFAPADRRRAGRSGSASGSGGLAAVSAARAARGAALNPYRKFSQGGCLGTAAKTAAKTGDDGIIRQR